MLSNSRLYNPFYNSSNNPFCEQISSAPDSENVET